LVIAAKKGELRSWRQPLACLLAASILRPKLQTTRSTVPLGSAQPDSTPRESSQTDGGARTQPDSLVGSVSRGSSCAGRLSQQDEPASPIGQSGTEGGAERNTLAANQREPPLLRPRALSSELRGSCCRCRRRCGCRRKGRCRRRRKRRENEDRSLRGREKRTNGEARRGEAGRLRLGLLWQRLARIAPLLGHESPTSSVCAHSCCAGQCWRCCATRPPSDPP